MLIDKDTYIRMGLAKSAFKESIYRQLPIDYYVSYINDTWRLCMRLHKIASKLYQSHDAFLMFYQPYDVVFQSLKKANRAAPIWRDVVESAISKDEFYRANSVTQGSTELSVIAAVKFLKNLLAKTDFEALHRALQQLQQGGQQAQRSQQLSQYVESAIQEAHRRAEEALKEALQAVQEFGEAKEAAENAITALVGAGGHGFTKDALSAWHYLEKPDEFRKRVRLLSVARQFFAKFLTAVPTSLQHQQVVSVYGGINGVTKMTAEKQLSDVLPSELALTQLGDVGRALLAVKVAQRQLMVYQRSASVRPVVFVDKSGSMAEEMKGVPKISVAAGLALALHKKLNADVYLFDTECDKVEPAKVVEVLMTISADGGTNVDPVLEEIVRLGKEELTYIIVSDGITEASPEVLKAFEASGLAKRTKLILVPPSSLSYNWVRLLERYDNVRYVYSAAEFEVAARRALTS